MWTAIKQYFLPPERVRMPSEDREAYEEWLEEQSRLADTIEDWRDCLLYTSDAADDAMNV